MKSSNTLCEIFELARTDESWAETLHRAVQTLGVKVKGRDASDMDTLRCYWASLVCEGNVPAEAEARVVNEIMTVRHG